MRINLAKNAVAVSVLMFLSMSSNAIAGPNSPSSPNLSGWSVNLGGSYQQFSNNGTAFAENSLNRTYNIDPDYHFGYNLGLGYHVPSKDSDIGLNYTHLNTSDKTSVWSDGLSLTTDTVVGPFGWVSGKNDFKYDSVDLTAGHQVGLSPSFGLNYYGGLNYTHLAKDMTLYGTNPGVDYTNNLGTNFNGFGPTFGMDGECHPFESSYPRFSVTGGVKASALYGTMTGYSRVNDNGIRSSDSIPNEKTVVPGVGAKLGLDYDLPLTGMNLKTELGYQLTEYFGVTKSSNYASTSTNASFQGAYLNLHARF